MADNENEITIPAIGHQQESVWKASTMLNGEYKFTNTKIGEGTVKGSIRFMNHWGKRCVDVIMKISNVDRFAGSFVALPCSDGFEKVRRCS